MSDESSIGRRLHDWLFPPDSAVHLGVFRILCFLHLFVLLQFGIFRGLEGMGEIPEGFYQPISFFKWLGIPKPGVVTNAVLLEVLKVAVLLSCLGLLTRVSMAVSLGIAAYLLGVAQCFGKVHHGSGLIIIMLGILALSPAGRACSLDAWLRSRIGSSRSGTPAKRAGSGWVFRLIWLTYAMAMMGAGLSKLRGGLAGGWFGGEGMSSLLRFNHYILDPPVDWGLALAQSQTVCLLMAVGTVTIETLCPLALFIRRLRLPLIGSLFLMQAGIALLLGVHTNFPWLMFYVAWIPWPGRTGRSGSSE